MARRETIITRVGKKFVCEILDKIIENEKKRGREKTSYADASEILRQKIQNAGGIKSY